MRFNPRVSVYWLWLVVIAGVLAMVPCASYPGKMGRTNFVSVAFVYTNALRGYNDSYTLLTGGKWILLHAAASVGLAVVATVIHHVLAKRFRSDCQPESKTFTLGGLLLTIAAVACVFSLLSSLGSISAVYLVALIFLAGRFATLLLAAVGL
jgi:hypothetical protein